MKKLFLFFMLLSLVGCGTTPSEPEVSVLEETEITTPQTTDSSEKETLTTEIAITPETEEAKEETSPGKSEVDDSPITLLGETAIAYPTEEKTSFGEVEVDDSPITLLGETAIAGPSDTEISDDKNFDYTENINTFPDITIEETDNKVTLNLPTEKLAVGSINRKLEFNKVGENYTSSLVLEFDAVSSYELIETIPKSFAASASDLEFSIQPEIIEDDPVVKWFIDRQVSRIEVKAKDRIVGAATVAGIAARLKGGNKKDAAVKAGADEAIMILFDSVDDFAILNHIRKCDFYENEIQQQECIFQLVNKYPTQFTEKDCEGLNGFFYLQETWSKACKAIVSNDIYKCEFKSDNIFDNSNQKTLDKYLDKCRNYYYQFKDNNCKDENCMYDVCMKGFDVNCCKFIKTPLANKKCLAKTAMNYIYCLDIEDKVESKKCCNNMMIDKDKDKCLSELEEETVEYEVIPEEAIAEEEADQDDFSSRSSNCPYPVSDDAVWVEKGYNYNRIQGWQEGGKWVGAVTKYWNFKENKIMNIVCMKHDLKHGPKIEYSENGGRKVLERNWMDGKAHGTWTNYWKDGSVSIIEHRVDGLKNGEYKARFQNGTVSTEGAHLNHHSVGKWTFYNKQGGLSMEQEYDANGKQIFYKKY